MDERTKKSVSFASKKTGIRIQHHKDMTKEQKSAIWYDVGEFSVFKKECRETILIYQKLVEGGFPVSSTTRSRHEERGLEHVIYKSARFNRYDRRRQALELVLAEQNEQIENGVCDQESISALYNEISASCQEEAHLRAVRDEEAAFEYQNEATVSEKKKKKKKGGFMYKMKQKRRLPLSKSTLSNPNTPSAHTLQARCV